MYIPNELLKRIFSFQEDWWLTKEKRIINIQKLSQIFKNNPISIAPQRSMYEKTWIIKININNALEKTYFIGYMENYEYRGETSRGDLMLVQFFVDHCHNRINNSVFFSYDHHLWNRCG